MIKIDEREFDGLVAEHIMGWAWYSAVSKSFLIPPSGQQYFDDFHVHWTKGKVSKHSYDDKTTKCKPHYNIELIYSDHTHLALPHYFTDIKDSMLVIKRMGELGFKVIISQEAFTPKDKRKGQWRVYFLTDDEEHWKCHHENLSTAICTAALEAVGHKI